MPRRLKGQGRTRAKLLDLGSRSSGTDSASLLSHRRRLLTIAVLAGSTISVLLVLISWLACDSPTVLQNKAEASARAGDWGAALQYWKAFNATTAAHGFSYLGEARAYLALSRAGQAEISLQRAIATEPSDPEAWQLLLQILFIEDRTLEAQRIGWKAYANIRSEARPALLRTVTLGLLTDLPNDQIRTMLQRWINADPDDLNAQIALWKRIILQPHPTDPDRPTVVAALEALLVKYPDQVAVREVLITALADAGEPDRGRALLKTWPQSMQDARYWRLRGRWDLEYDHQPQHAVSALQTALVDLPQDWRSWYRLARALHIVGRDGESGKAAQAVTCIREALDPLVLEPRLDAAFDHLGDPAALRDLAGFCSQIGLKQLAEAWLIEAQQRQTQH
jgi:thioredoxin-like negative regulator of GroEL